MSAQKRESERGVRGVAQVTVQKLLRGSRIYRAVGETSDVACVGKLATCLGSTQRGLGPREVALLQEEQRESESACSAPADIGAFVRS